MRSDFVQQQHSVCDFSNSDSWVILSPIEQSIKRKIEAVGTPLKDWDIQINYGEDERKRTAELIRPILRGRDIKRYGYDWADLWLIATFPSRKYRIDDYPSVRNYLLSFAYDYLMENGNEEIAINHLADFCIQKLSQTGQHIIINGKNVLDAKGNKEKGRKKTSNKWFETQDSISYWDLFFQPHICWKAVGRNLTFAIVPSGTFLTAPASFISAEDKNDYILAFLCSKIGKYYIYQNSDTTGAGDIMLNIQSLIQFPIPQSIDNRIIELCKELQKNPNGNLQDKLDDLIYKSYGFNAEEISEIERC